MKNLSKVLAVVLAFAMALSMVSFAAYTDVEAGADCEEAVTVLSALEILTGYEDGSFKPENTITRAEFATVVIRMLGLADSVSGGSTIFTDVAADHWANGYIALAAQQGIVNGYGDGRFGPEDPVKYQEAIKMVVAALGYTPMADANGGYPGGYKVVASQKGILAGISGAKDSEPATRGIVAQLAYNSLTVPLMEQVGFGTEISYKTVGSLLLNKLGVTKFEGVVEATSLSSNLKDGKIKVDYNYQITAEEGKSNAVKYAAPNANCNPFVADFTDVTIAAKGEVEAAAKDLVDVASVLYVKDADSDKAELVCILKDGNKNETISFMSEDLKTDAAAANSNAGLTANTTDTTADGTIEVYTDIDAGDYEEYSLAIKKVYINGRTTSIATASGVAEGATIDTAAELKAVLDYYLDDAKAVDVTLLSQEEDEFNVAYITTYIDARVDRIADRTWKVATTLLTGGSGTKTIVLDETDKDQKFEIYKDGELASFADIKEDDVLSIAGYINASNELAYGKVYIVSDKVEGKVTAKSASANKLTVDGETYKADTNALTANLGDTAVFYVNHRGVLVDVDTTATAANVKYGFATYIREYDAEYGEPAQIRLLNTEGKWETIELAETISINNGAREKSKNVTWTGVTAGAGTGYALANVTGSSTKYAVNNVVAYDLNSAGQVAKLYLKADVMDIFYEEGISEASIDYHSDTFMFGDDIFVDEATVIFSDNSTSSVIGTTADTDESDIAIVALGSLADGSDCTITYAYDYDDSGVAGALLGKAIAGGIDFAADFFVVTDDAMASTNEAGEEGILLTGVQAGEEVTLFINNEDADYTVSKADYDATTSAGLAIASQLDGTIASTVTDTTFAKGDVLLYTLNSKGEAAKIALLVDASDVAKAVGTGAYTSLDSIDNVTASGFDTIVATASVGSTEYKFVFGYAMTILKNGNVTLMDGSAEKTYSFASTAFGTRYDAYVGTSGKVTEAMTADITTDSNADGSGLDGDMVFAKVVGSRIAEFVVIGNSN